MEFRAPRLRTALPLLALGAALIACGLAAGPRAAAAPLSAPDLQRLAAASSDSSQARAAAEELREYLASDPDSTFVPYARLMLVRALMTVRAPVGELVPEIARAAAVLPDRPEASASFLASTAAHFVQRGEALDTALSYADKAVKLCPKDEQYAGLRSFARATLGQVQLLRGQTGPAIASLNLALGSSPDSQGVLFHLGQAYEKAGKSDAAIGAYVRSLGVFAGRDSSAAAPLGALWRKRHGSLAGLDEKVTAARRASRARVALDGRRLERVAPGWTLPDLDGKNVRLADFKDKVVVLDFWGTWCGPCRLELPHFQALYERYKDSPGIAFLSLNWERAQNADEHARMAREFMRKNNYTFPVVFDFDRLAVQSYEVPGFPTVFLIDRAGKIRYRNVGYDPGISDIVEAQIQSLLE